MNVEHAVLFSAIIVIMLEESYTAMKCLSKRSVMVIATVAFLLLNISVFAHEALLEEEGEILVARG